MAWPRASGSDASSDRGRRMALGALSAGMFVLVVDLMVAGVALPSIQIDLGFSQTGLV